MSFLFLGVKNVEQCWDGTLGQSTKFRNDQDNGPRKYPDLLSYIKNHNYCSYNYEFLFLEISYGPFSPDDKHTEGDLFRLCKFANDAWKHIFYFVEKFEDNEEMLELLNQLEIILLHKFTFN